MPRRWMPLTGAMLIWMDDYAPWGAVTLRASSLTAPGTIMSESWWSTEVAVCQHPLNLPPRVESVRYFYNKRSLLATAKT